MYEKITFTNGITDYFNSVDLHKINFICEAYNLDFFNYKQFNEAWEILQNTINSKI